MKFYFVPGWPGNVRGQASVTPYFNRHAGSGALQYKDGVTGQPGTQGIPVDPIVPSPDPGDIALMGLSRTSDAPLTIYPNLYWARPQRAYRPGAGMPVSYQSDNLMPVPAVDPRGLPSAQYMPVSNGIWRGHKSITQPPVTPRWNTQ